MAPDLNSVPASPRNLTAAQPVPGGMLSLAQSASRQSSTPNSRRTSQIYPMSPPPLPLASPGGSVPPSSHHSHSFPPLSPSFGGHVSNVDAAGVPMRHPRPLSTAELHLELEKEQEAIVNRLTRELSALRAHSTSVASTASSAISATVLDGPDHHGPTHPTSARRHRSSSSVSRGSINAPYSGPTTFATGIPLTRSASAVSTPRYEEVAHYKQELEEAKRENEVLKSRIRELERAIKGDVDIQRGRAGAPPTVANGGQRC
ncbi:hypothetical protein K504DRAFT_372947 [Pleomassaria siparia CBS 279.74]|uniref:Uncharacterized protein n=1 Tax=Pleomassaria siparia CBS 279.74 TaxID=1314801 RepID=A0A6G1KHA9_9PLEO|nr:hypothetical protein K504DRAFT_372947 [Pleomassaria siparia CBS 279.74]